MTQPPPASPLAQDLTRVRESVLAMGGRVEEAIALAARALDTRDEDLAARVVEGDQAIDAMEEDIDAQIVSLLARQQPTGADLRAVIAVMKIAGDLERLGDYAKNMAKRVSVLATGAQIEGASAAIRRQSRQVGQMLKDMLDALAREDVPLAEDVIARDVEVDHMTNALFREFITHMMEDPRNITACLHYTFIAKNTERMGDLVTGAAEQIVFLSTGTRPTDRVKGTSTAEIGPIEGRPGNPAA